MGCTARVPSRHPTTHIRVYLRADSGPHPSALAKSDSQPSGPRSSILGPAGGLVAAGLPFTVLLGLVSGTPPFARPSAAS